MATKKNETTNKSSADKQKALDFAVSFLEKQFGKGTLMRLGDKPHVEVGAISTGSLAIDAAIGIGGLPKGRVIEIYGPESSGKTTLTLNLIAEAQKAGGNCAFVDAEHALDPEYAEKLGVNLQDLLISQPDDGEQALEIVDSLVRSGAIDVLIVDSVAALTPRQEIEGDMDQLSVGLQARLMSKALRKITASVSKTGCMVVFINQIRMKIGGYGNPETTTGGNALKFYSSVRLEIRRGKAIMKGEEPVGTEANVKIVKNKVAPPFKKAEIEILFGRGISKESELVSLGAKYDILQKSGSWYSYNGDKIGQGKDNVRLYLMDKPELAQEIQDKIMAKVKGAKTEDSEQKTENEKEN